MKPTTVQYISQFILGLVGAVAFLILTVLVSLAIWGFGDPPYWLAVIMAILGPSLGVIFGVVMARHMKPKNAIMVSLLIITGLILFVSYAQTS